MGGFKRNVALYIMQFELRVWSQTYCHLKTDNNNLETYSVTNYGSGWWKDVVTRYLEIVSTSFKMSQTCIQTAKQLSLYARTARTWFRTFLHTTSSLQQMQTATEYVSQGLKAVTQPTGKKPSTTMAVS